MQLDSPSIILLTIDGLRYDRLACNGYPAGHTPTFDRLSREGVAFRNYHCHGSPTQFAFPTIFSSTYPLDEGGYGTGIRHRAASFVEVLKEAGYWTVGLSLGGALTSVYGYNRGFDHFHHLNEISVPLTNAWKNEVAYYRRLFEDGQLTLGNLADNIGPSIEDALTATIQACAEKHAEASLKLIATTRDFHGADFARISDMMQAELERFRANRLRYLEALMAYDSVHQAYPVLPLPLVSRNRLVGRIHDYVNKALSVFDVTLRFGRRKHMAAKQVFASVDRYLERANGRKFFIWGHVIDVHDMYYGNGKVDLPPLAGPTFRKIRRLGRHYRGLRRYDYAVTHVDGYLGRLLERLRQLGLDRNTLLVVTSDHGLAANWPRPHGSHVASFYEEHCHLPLVFHHPDLAPRQIGGLFGSVDLAPTLLGLLNLPVPSAFRGVNALAAPSRPYILMENLGRGPHDLERKAVRLAIRTLDRKYIMDDDGGLCQIREVYDLREDPDELANLVHVPVEQEGSARMVALGAERCAEIRSAR